MEGSDDRELCLREIIKSAWIKDPHWLDIYKNEFRRIWWITILKKGKVIFWGNKTQTQNIYTRTLHIQALDLLDGCVQVILRLTCGIQKFRDKFLLNKDRVYKVYLSIVGALLIVFLIINVLLKPCIKF